MEPSSVGRLIEHECGVALHVSSVGKYLALWGFALQKPIKKACEKRPEVFQAWIDKRYQATQAQARA